MQQAAVIKFNNKGKFLIHGVSRTKEGIGVANDPYVWMDIQEPLEDVVRQILIALSESDKPVQTPSDWVKFLKSVLEKMGLTKNKELYQSTLNVSVSKKGNSIGFMPTVNTGAKTGFRNGKYEKVEVDESSGIPAIALALQDALSKCE